VRCFEGFRKSPKRGVAHKNVADVRLAFFVQ